MIVLESGAIMSVNPPHILAREVVVEAVGTMGLPFGGIAWMNRGRRIEWIWSPSEFLPTVAR